MAEALRHRGPDDDGLWTDPQGDIGFAHRRLSIIDLDGGRQPIANETGTVVTMCNGEIYNYRELCEELAGRGHQLRTNSDTEVIVHLYEELGIDFVERLRGMFAIALWDAAQRQLVLLRDRVGKKPLYYSESADEFLFASEIKGLIAAAKAPLDLDRQSLFDYLSWGTIHAPATIYRQVRSVEPGQLLVIRDRRVARRQEYWRLELLPKTEIRPDEAVEQIDGLLRESVRLRLRSDVPVGAFLSGGIDSGVITALAAEYAPGQLITVTVGFEDAGFDERPLARQVAQRYSTDHHEIVIRPEVARDLPVIADTYDQPFADSSAVPSFYVAQAAREFVKVALNGDGGDELLAGYRRYVAARLSGTLSWLDGTACRRGWQLLHRLLPEPRGYRTGYAFAHRLVRGLAQDPADRYWAWAVDVLSETEKADLSHPGRGSWVSGAEPGPRLADRLLTELQDAGPVDRMLGMDFSLCLPHDLLVKMDIACMARGLEARSPLLDHVLAETVARYPEDVKLPGFQTKPLLRRLGRRYLPRGLCAAPKRGFEVPVVRWLRGELRSLCEDIMLSPSGLLAEMFDRRALEELVHGGSRAEPARWGRQVWTLLMLGMWDRYARAG
jgi:asparagine synthase (glutamine-hydrolysing)